MVVEGRRRVLALFETHWDRKQLAACREAWEGSVEIDFPPPDDVACPADFDPLGFVEASAGGSLGRVDGVFSSSDYPGATVAAAMATRLGLPGPRPERVIEASHKYYSRLAQRRAAPEAVPRFALVDARDPRPPEIPFPLFVKPVKGAFSVLARRIESFEALRAFLAAPAVTEFTGGYMAIFNQLVAGLTGYPIDGHYFIAEELLRGQLVTVEGFVCDGRVSLLGIVDSVVHPNGSFARFDYPSSLPSTVQARMEDVARRVVLGLGLERACFNIEMIHDPADDRVAIVEVNPRLCGQFADLYQKVDGSSGYQVALALALGESPELRRGAGPCTRAASVPLRVFEPSRVLRAPDPADVSAAEAIHPGTLIWSECAAGEALADFDVDEDGASHRYAIVNLGAGSAGELDAALAAVVARLGYVLEPLGG
jgi:hypothetical protein